MSIEDKEFDFYEIDEKLSSEIPLELKHKIENVLSVLKEDLEKLKISLILPKILENPKVLQLYLENTKYSNCLKLVQNYRNRWKSESLQDVDNNDYDLIQIIDYFQEDYKILEVLPNWLDDIDNTEKDLLTAFENVYEIAQQRFQRPAKAVLAKEKRLHGVYLANEKVLQKIKEAMHRIETKGINRLWKDVAKSGAIKKLEDEFAFIQYDNKMFVEREKFASRREIQRINNSLKAKQSELEENLKKSRLNYETELKANLIKEKNISDERKKLQLHLQALIKKYDETICEKNKQEILLQEEHDIEKQEFDNFLKEYKKEETLYQETVQEYKTWHENKIFLFTYACAAKKIQRWWKEVLRKLTKPRKGKAKSGAKHNTTKEKTTAKVSTKRNLKKSYSKGKG